MNEIGPRPLLHLQCARHALADALYSLRAARTELHKIGPHAQAAARIIKTLDRTFPKLQRLIQRTTPGDKI